jgi:tRNA pseudouridine55 synthase
VSTAKAGKRAISGWLVLDKPHGMTSTQAVGKVRWLFGAMKAGHAGTLDPLATGILPIALGEATKTVSAVQEGRKVYRFAIRWGAATTTDDVEGAVVVTSDHRPAQADVEAKLEDFIGEIMQRPPAFSAIRLEGERAYDIARAGGEVALAARPVVIESLHLLGHGEETSEFEMACEKGTYVRAVARDLAEALGTRGHVASLRRTAVGAFTEAKSVTIDAIEAAADRDALLLPVAEGLSALPEVRLSPEQAGALRQGKAVLLTGAKAPVALEFAWASLAGEPVALGVVEQGHFKPRRVLVSNQ